MFYISTAFLVRTNRLNRLSIDDNEESTEIKRLIGGVPNQLGS